MECGNAVDAAWLTIITILVALQVGNLILADFLPPL